MKILPQKPHQDRPKYITPIITCIDLGENEAMLASRSQDIITGGYPDPPDDDPASDPALVRFYNKLWDDMWE